ncbi:hypothetical protein OH76DRAFT_1438155 [Lentinus brumalis]|uniref:Fungal-type protein kinase domain-containing protein n=1 Tax=Lentinus brumalis TaxID=2498619 RepID=A0A371DBD8_9APHY|nr:hypothetical protein OH76DRAFT_1438155 [Polyporus brumalis]
MTQKCVYDVPMARNLSLVTLGLDPNQALARNLQHLAESRHFTLRSMPVQSFIDTFVPEQGLCHDRTRYLSSANAFRAVPVAAKSAEQIYHPLIAALNKSTSRKSRCPSFVFEDVASRSLHPRRFGYMKPHVCCFTSESLELVRGHELSSRSEFGYTELFFEVKPHPLHDYFSEPIYIYDSDDDASPVVQDLNKALGQHIAYVTEIFARQFRVFFFTVSMAGSLARLLRWDRSGCIVSEPFDVRERPDLLCEFLWRFAHASEAGRGHDITVEPALAEDESLFEALITQETALQLGVTGQALRQAVKQHYEPGKVMAIHVLDQGATEESPTVRRFLVSRPVVSPLSLSGRGTRGFWAVDVVSRRVVFVKDTWRTGHSEGKEGDTLKHLVEVGVRNIPHVVAHGDVPTHIAPTVDVGDFQITKTDSYKSAPWQITVEDTLSHMSRRKHYRLVLGSVGYDIRFLRGTEELLHASYDVFTAIRDASEKDSRVHRDVSTGNIILVREHSGQKIRKGVLIDWESSCGVDDTGLATKAGRGGTWLFMSRELLYDHENLMKPSVKDDMESLLYVVLYCALHWLPHNYSKDKLTDLITAFFEHKERYDPGIMGGRGKIINAENRYFTRGVVFGSPAIKEWLDTVMDYMSPRAHQKETFKDKWNLEQMDAFWTEFLQTHKLEGADRVSHDLTKRTLPLEAPTSESYSSSSSASPSPVPQTRPVRTSRRLSSKRPQQTSPTTSDSKRARNTRSARSQPGPSEQTSLRRSERIRNQQTRRPVAASGAVRSAAAARGSAPKTSNARPARSAGPSRGRGGRSGARGGGAARK